ncbi:MAG TPA: DMT family transporter [Acidimicrobiia bacterium]
MRVTRQFPFAAEGALVLAAFLFGVTFVLVQDAIEDITPTGYVTLRFLIGAAALAPFAWVIARRRREPARLLWSAGTIAGLLLFAAYLTQTVGLQYTESSTSAFITGLYVVFTPIIEAIARRRVPPAGVSTGIGVATVGLFLLTGAELALGRGELLTLACAVLFAGWIVYQGSYANRLDTIPFTTVQMSVLALVSIPPTAVTGIGQLTGVALFAAALTGIACSSGALSLQLYGQRRVSPSRAALILLLEPVFAGVAGYVAGERLGAVKLTGAAVILVGIAIAELVPDARGASLRSARRTATRERGGGR